MALGLQMGLGWSSGSFLFEYTVIPAKEKGESARYPKPSIAIV